LRSEFLWAFSSFTYIIQESTLPVIGPTTEIEPVPEYNARMSSGPKRAEVCCCSVKRSVEEIRLGEQPSRLNLGHGIVSKMVQLGWSPIPGAIFARLLDDLRAEDFAAEVALV